MGHAKLAQHLHGNSRLTGPHRNSSEGLDSEALRLHGSELTTITV